MTLSRAYFRNKFDLLATDFTVLVGENHAALAPVYKELVGVELSAFLPPHAIETTAWVTYSTTDRPVVAMIYGTEPYNSDKLGTLVHYVVHEYFHVLQDQLASGLSNAPRWLVEGHASNADYLYSCFKSDRLPFPGRPLHR